MNIHLEALQHQRDALNAVLNNFPALAAMQPDFFYANPVLQNADEKTATDREQSFIDIKMETGTGKTYVYTRAMYELHQKYGLYKFIIVAPSLAIKEGTKNFIQSDYARQHFSTFFPNKKIELQTVSAGDFTTKKGKRKNIPVALMQFCEATKNEKNTIQCLLLSDKGFLDRADSALFKDDYDQTLFGGYACPIDAIKNTLPILIIDEPHRLKRDGKSYANIMEKISPQVIIRFGATFPDIKTGKGTSSVIKKDFYRGTPQFDLGAVEAFNQDLVKGVDVQFPHLPENAADRYRVKSVTGKELVLSKNNKEWLVKIGENLSMTGGRFEGDVRYDGNKQLSTGLELAVGMELIEGVFSNAYQELLLQQAVDAHFETEIKNFHRNGYKVKTHTLFFIDSITSYREKNGWLKCTFEKLLKAKLDALLAEYRSGDYHDYLAATKKNIGVSHGGYFARDWGEPDESAVAEEREDILYKERTLSFKKANGEWNIRRFFFSKWALREGWDNPNVFTICKLRTSGSETSKIQEVGRGLRLPVDEKGNRLSNEAWKLNFIIGWDEKDFAEKLIGEINRDAKIVLNKELLTPEMITIICKSRNITPESLLEQLDAAEIVNRANAFKDGGYEKLLALYPELLQTQIKNGKITSPLITEKQKKIKLRTNNWKKIAEFWQEVSKRYMLSFERIDTGIVSDLFGQVLRTDGVFDDNKAVMVTVKGTRKTADRKIMLEEKTLTIATNHPLGKIPYNEFVEKLAQRTALPVQILHTQLWKALREHAAAGLDTAAVNAQLNQNSLEKIIALWCQKFVETFAAKYTYDALYFTAETAILQNGSFVSELPAGYVGNFEAADIADDPRNLYETPLFYDSEQPEHAILKISPPQKITVFGKIPRRAIKVPTYTGGSTTPDFVYAVETEAHKNLYILLETKAQDMRGAEKLAVECQERLFAIVQNVQWHLITDADEVRRLLSGF